MSVDVTVTHAKPEPGDGYIEKQPIRLDTGLVLVNHMFHNHHVIPVRIQEIERRSSQDHKIVICCGQFHEVDMIGDWHYRAGQEMVDPSSNPDGYAYTFTPDGQTDDFYRLLEMVQAYVHMIPSLQPSPATLVRT